MNFLANYFFFLFPLLSHLPTLKGSGKLSMFAQHSIKTVSQRIMSLLENLLTPFDVKGKVSTSYSCFQESFKVTISHQGTPIQKTVSIP